MANEDSNNPNLFSWSTTNGEQDRGAETSQQAEERLRRLGRRRAFIEGLPSLHRPILPSLQGPECESACWRQEQLPESATASPFGSVTQSVSSSLWLPQAQSRTRGQQFSPGFQLQRPDQLTQIASVYSSSLPQYQTRSLAVASPFGSNFFYDGQPSSAAPGEASWDCSPWLKTSLSPPHHMRPGAPHNVPFVPPRPQTNYSSIPAKSPQGVLKPPVNLSQWHQPMSEAQPVNNDAMSDLERAFERCMVLESENNFLKALVHHLTETNSRSIQQIAKLDELVTFLCNRLGEVKDQVGLPGSSSKRQLYQGMETGCSADQNENPVKMEFEDQLPTRELPSPLSSPGRRSDTEPLQETREHPSPLSSPGRRPDTEPLQETREHPPPTSSPGRSPGNEPMQETREDPSPPSSGRRPDEVPVQENFQRNDRDESATSSSAIEASDSTACGPLEDTAQFPLLDVNKNPPTKAEIRRQQYGGSKG